MASTVVSIGSNADVQLFTGMGYVVGIAAKESAGTPALASFFLRDGTGTGDPVIFPLSLLASTSFFAALPAVKINTGLYLDRVAGTTDVVVYLL